jgi:hypothetical protein
LLEGERRRKEGFIESSPRYHTVKGWIPLTKSSQLVLSLSLFLKFLGGNIEKWTFIFCQQHYSHYYEEKDETWSVFMTTQSGFLSTVVNGTGLAPRTERMD